MFPAEISPENGELTDEERALMDRFALEMRLLAEKHESFHVHLSAFEAWQVLAQLQLAQRHPGNSGESGAVGRHIIRYLASELAPRGTARHEVYQRGGAA